MGLNINRVKSQFSQMYKQSDFGFDEITVATSSSAETISETKSDIKVVLNTDTKSLGIRLPDSTLCAIGKRLKITVPASAYTNKPLLFINDSADTINGVNANYTMEYGYGYELVLIDIGRWGLSSQFGTDPIIPE